MRKFYAPVIFLFCFFSFANVLAQLPQIDFLPPPPGPPDACDLGGTYSIGPDGDYVTITQALDSLKSRGISTNVILELKSSYTSNGETFPIVFPKDTEIPCYIDIFSLTIRPAAGVTNAAIHGNTSKSIFQLDSCSYVTIDGRPGGVGSTASLTIANDSSGNAIEFINASHNSIIYTNLSGAIPALSGNKEGVISFYSFSNRDGSNFNRIKNCKIYSQVINFVAKPVLVYALTEDATAVNTGDSLIDCEFYNFSGSAIQIENAADKWIISGNSFYKNTSLTFNPDVQMIKINTPGTEASQTISGNFFGGTQPLCGGAQMKIPFSGGFSFIDVTGQCNISDNRFAKLTLECQASTALSQASMVNVNSTSNITASYIINNTFGIVATADTVAMLNNSATDVQFSCISVTSTTNYYIGGNIFSGIKTYSPGEGGIHVAVIRSNGGVAHVRNNQLGDPATLFTDIVNFTNAPLYGVECLTAGAVVTDNTICHLDNFNTGSLASVQGIMVNRGLVDSICRNRIFHLSTYTTSNNDYAPLAGIFVSPDNNGGVANCIEGNNIYSLHNHSTYQGGAVAGIVAKSNLFIRSNFIHNLNSSDAFTTSIYGILIPDKESVLENNMISLGLDSNGASITAGNLAFYGIDGGNVIKHNSVYIGGKDVQDGFMGSACLIFIGTALNTEYHNNIFVNNRSNLNETSSAPHQCINIDLSYTGNYNMFFFNGQGGVLGTYQNVRYKTLALWQGGAVRDESSIFADPVFISPSATAAATNLHLSYGSIADGGGNNGYTVNTDFDGQDRSSLTPVDLGADAGNYSSCPLANAGPDITVFEGTAVQLGSDSLFGVQYSWTGPNGFNSTAATPVITPTSNGIYILTITTGNNCADSDYVSVNVLPALSSTVCPGGSINFPSGNASAASYQWQVNANGAGYTNISSGTGYAGVNSDTLHITNASSSWYGYKYRCLTDGNAGIVYSLTFKNTWTGAADNTWGNPANWSCNVVPDAGTDVIINSGTVILDQNGTCRTLYVAPGVTFNVNAGFTLTITH